MAVDISCNGESLERVTRSKLLGIHMHEHLTWNNHINELVTSCYGALAVLKKLRNLAPFRVKKQLVESLILSMLDCLQLGWLPLIECRSYQLLQCIFKALYFDYWPQ